MTTMLSKTSGATSRQDVQDELDELFRLDGEGAGELLLVRHAEPARPAAATCDPLLSCAGLEQAERLAERLETMWLEAVYTSPERRTLQTAKLIADSAGRPLHVIDELREIDFEPAEAAVAGAVSYAERFVQDPRWDSLPGFGLGKAYRRRVIMAIEAALAASEGRRVVVVTHASAINAYLSMLLSIPRDQFFTPEHASLSLVRWQDDRYALRSLNDVTHLHRAGAESRRGAFTLR